MFKNIMKKLKSRRGNSLAEFAVTTAMMATLAATAAPQFGSVGEGAKEKKTMNNIDKIIQAANNYYNQKLDVCLKILTMMRFQIRVRLGRNRRIT